VEPIMQLTCRDRNRIALQSDLLSASAMGIPNVLLMTGDHPRFGDHAEAKPVFDLDSIALLRAARAMRDERKLMSGRMLDPAPSWLLGAVENPAVPADLSRPAPSRSVGYVAHPALDSRRERALILPCGIFAEAVRHCYRFGDR
jgi:5,10-methylenetetrahydrofolate reductase